MIIPTTLRAELARAIESVVGQTIGRDRIEVVVVVDRSIDPDDERLIPIASKVDRLIITGGRTGGGCARQLGTSASTGTWVAYLDDDDTWLPTKLEIQLAAASQALGGEDLVMSCRFVERDAVGRLSEAMPARIYRQQHLAEYLFRRRGPVRGRPALPTSTLMASKVLALRTPWAEGLSRHQDWDWLLRLNETPNVRIVQLPDMLVVKDMGSPGSISSKADWRGSLQWFETVSGSWSRGARADFLASGPLRYAIQARSRSGLLRVAKSIRAQRVAPSPLLPCHGTSGASAA